MITLGAREVDVQRELHRLRVELEELRASRRRLVLAADADRRTIERELHDGVAAAPGRPRGQPAARSDRLADSDPAAAQALSRRDGPRRAGRRSTRRRGSRSGSTRRLLEAGGLAALLRSAAAQRRRSAPRSTSPRPGSYPPEVAMTDLPVLARRARARRRRRRAATIARARGGRARSAFEVVARRRRDVELRISTGCATASRPSAAG